MWRVWHRLFGWHFVHLENTATSIIRRVRTTHAGERYVKYFGAHLVFLDRDSWWTITPLTWTEPVPEESKTPLRAVN